MLLLNLCRKYAYKFNKLFPLCESALSNNCKNQSLDELKNMTSDVIRDVKTNKLME